MDSSRLAHCKIFFGKLNAIEYHVCTIYFSRWSNTLIKIGDCYTPCIGDVKPITNMELGNNSCLWRFVVKLRHSIRAVSGAPLSSSGLEEAL